jgi:hypothetical protein
MKEVIAVTYIALVATLVVALAVAGVLALAIWVWS